MKIKFSIPNEHKKLYKEKLGKTVNLTINKISADVFVVEVEDNTVTYEIEDERLIKEIDKNIKNAYDFKGVSVNGR